MMTLYEMTEDYRMLLEMAEDPDVDPAVLKDTMDGIEGAIEEKAEGYAMVMKELEASENAIKNEIDRLNARRLTIANSVRCMKLSLQEAMELTGKTKFKTDLFSFGIQKNPAKVVITDESRVAHDFWIPQPAKIDLKRIKTCLDEGFEFDWAHLEQSESLRIR